MDSHSFPVILTYHSISEGRLPLCTPPRVFAEQMAWLAAEGHRVISLAELADALIGKQSFPRRVVVLTFDDGFLDFYEAAFPILRQFDFPATVFLVTQYCGRTNRWPGQAAWAEELPLLDWQQVKEMDRRGMAFGSHTATHPDLSQLAPEEVEREVLTSKRELEAQLGRPVEFFCYPSGRLNRESRAIISRHFRGACSVNMQRVRPGCDLFGLPRIDAYYLRSPALFRQLFTRPGSLYLGFRRMLRAVRWNYETFLTDHRSKARSL